MLLVWDLSAVFLVCLHVCRDLMEIRDGVRMLPWSCKHSISTETAGMCRGVIAISYCTRDLQEKNTYLMEVLVPQTILVPPNITWDFLNATSRVSPIITRKAVVFSSPFHLMSRQDAINSCMWLIATFSRSIPKS